MVKESRGIHLRGVELIPRGEQRATTLRRRPTSTGQEPRPFHELRSMDFTLRSVPGGKVWDEVIGESEERLHLDICGPERAGRSSAASPGRTADGGRPHPTARFTLRACSPVDTLAPAPRCITAVDREGESKKPRRQRAGGSRRSGRNPSNFRRPCESSLGIPVLGGQRLSTCGFLPRGYLGVPPRNSTMEA